MIRGIDISNWQAGLNPGTLDIDFAICKATEGTSFVDPECYKFIQDLKRNGKKWGFYHFAGGGNAITEAEYFLQHTKGYDKQGIPVLDYEIWGNSGDVEWCEWFLMHYHANTGVWPLLYISASYCKDFQGSWIPDKCGLWVAGYPKQYTAYPVNHKMPYDVSPWKFAAIWQFTSSLNLDGTPLDGDYAYMSRDNWNAYANPAKDNKTPDYLIVGGKSCGELAREVLEGKWGNGADRKKYLDSRYGPGTYEHVQMLVNKELQK